MHAEEIYMYLNLYEHICMTHMENYYVITVHECTYIYDNSSHFIYEMCPFSDMAIYGAYTYKCICRHARKYMNNRNYASQSISL